MKKSELKQLVREAIISEMSGLSDIGISQEQLKTAHSKLGIKHDVSPKQVSNKTELKKALTDDTSDTNVLMGLDKQGDLYIAQQSDILTVV